MIYLSYKNYFKWYYNDKLFGNKETPSSTLEINFDTKVKSYGTFKEELVNNANKLVETYPNRKYSLLLSGGSESETMMRAFKEAKIDFTAYIFRYENDVNLYDVSFAISASESLNAKYKIIDFNLKKFYNTTEPERISEIAQLDYPRALVHCKFLDYITDDSIAVFGFGATGYHRTSDDYTKKGIWVNEFFDREQSWERYALALNREVCFSWFRFSPELVLAHHSTNWARKLRQDFFSNKLGGNSTKILGYKEAFPEMLTRKKQTGFENSYPEIMHIISEYEMFLFKKYNGFPYRGSIQIPIDQIFKKILLSYEYSD